MLRRTMMAAPSGPPPAGYTTLSSTDKSGNVALSGGNLVATGTVNGSGIARSIATITGKKYFEGVFTDSVGNGAVIAVGVATSAHGLATSLGYANPQGWAFWGSNVGARHNGATVIAQVGGDGATLGFAVDKDAGKLWIRDSNGVWMQGDPVAGTSPLWSNLTGNLYAAACPWANGTIVSMQFDPAGFKFPAPAGFSPMTS